MGQALTNLTKNAVESIEWKENNRSGGGGRKKDGSVGHIEIKVLLLDNWVEIVVEDNGSGLPEENRESLTEPYVTTREKGSGLGLAIVKKIMEDHQGSLICEDREEGGARIRLVLPRGNEFLSAGTPGRASGTGSDLPGQPSQPTASTHGK